MVAFTLGDVTIGGALSYAEHIRPDGSHVAYIHLVDDLGRDMVVNGMTFSAKGDMYAALGVPGATGGGYEPHDIVWMPNNQGLLTIVDTDGTTTGVQIWKYAMDAVTVLARYDVAVDAGWTYLQRLKLDVACDSKTVYYTDQGRTIFKYDISGTGTQLTAFDVLPDDTYCYGAFKLLLGDGPDIMIISMTNSTAEGPKRALCLDNDKRYYWNSLINPSSTYRAYKRLRASGTAVLNHVVGLDPAATNDLVWSLACWTIPCPGVVVSGWIVG